jgi:transcriptional regulator with XRE-family HTH domain
MTTSFGETLRRLRTEKGLSQQQLAVRLHMERPSVANWEAGRRMPDAATVYQIAEALSVDSSALLSAADDSGKAPNVLLVDDEPLIVTGGIPALQEAMPNANVVGFTKPSQALAFFSENPVALAFLDIELGRTSGLELCREMLRLRPRTNVIYLTAFREYAFDAWDTGACGYLLKPLETETVRAQLSRLRYPVKGLL